jgi:hypothetical protein
MATYRQNITQNIEPAQADWRTAARAIELQGKATETAIKGLSELGGMVYKGVSDYQVGQSVKEAEQVATEFTESNLRAEENMARFGQQSKMRSIFEDGALQPGQEGAEAGAALNAFDAQLNRLKQAAQGGMSTQEMLNRVSVLTKAAIAKNPDRADEIRQRVGAITGVQGADRYVINQYVASRLNPKDSGKNVQQDLAINTIKRIAPMGKWGSEGELYDLYQNNLPEFNSRVSEANQVATYKTNKDMVENKIGSEVAVGDDNARLRIPEFRAMFSEGFKANGLTNVWNNNNAALNDTMKLLATGKDPDIDPAAFNTLVQMHSAQVLSMANQAKVDARNAADNYFSTINPRASKAVRDEVYAAIDTTHDSIVAAYKPDSPIGLVAMARVRSVYAKESFEKQLQLQQLQVQQLTATSNSSLAKQYWAGGADRDRLKQTHPDFYNQFDGQVNRVLRGYATTQEMGQDAVSLANVQNLVNTASSAPTPLVKPENVTPQEYKAAVSSVVTNANAALDNAVKSGVLLPRDRTLVQTALSTQVSQGADANVLARDYAKMYERVSKLPSDDQSAIKASVSDASRTAVLNIGLAKSAVEAKYSTRLNIGVNAANQIVVLSTPTNNPQAGLEYATAREEFLKRTAPLLRNLVHGRAAVTGEQLEPIAIEFADAINNDERYLGFFSLEGKSTTSNAPINATMADIAAFAEEKGISIDEAESQLRAGGVAVVGK